MPIYEYQCTKCGHRFEVIQKLSDPPRKKCEKCKSKAERLVSSPAIQFKGSGWYITDYARKPEESKKTESGAKDESASKEKPSKEKSSGKAADKAGSTAGTGSK